MKRVIIIIGILAVLVVGGALLIGRDNKNSSANSSGAKDTAMQTKSSEPKFSDVLAAIDKGAKLYDVREPSEYTAGHFEQAENYSVQLMQNGQLPRVAKDTKIYVYCRSGARAATAAGILKQAGFTDVTSLKGLADIEAAGGKLIQ